jgi:hypothetical protein
VQREHVAKDCAVSTVVKIFRPNYEGDFIASLGQKKQAADDCPFSLDAPRRLAIEQFADAVAIRAARLFFYRGHRVDPSLSEEW